MPMSATREDTRLSWNCRWYFVLLEREQRGDWEEGVDDFMIVLLGDCCCISNGCFSSMVVVVLVGDGEG